MGVGRILQLSQPTGIDDVKTDIQLQHDVIAELKWDTSINSAQIGVAVNGGVVTLSGHVDKYSEKWAAERAALKVTGIKALAIEIEVVLPFTNHRRDSDIACTAETVLMWTTNWPTDDVQVMVENGWVTITGELDFAYQKESASNAVINLMGVKGISNQIVIRPTLTSSSVKSDIQAALKRRALTDAEEIMVSVDGGSVTLSGKVHSWSERDMVKDLVRNTHGVTDVYNNISIAY
jgi:osmotically-inducible protein OsmY